MTTPTPGLYPGLRFSEYLKLDAMNQSTLKEGLESVAHMQAAFEGATREPTDDMNLGSCLHMGFLEPEKLVNKVARWDGKTRRGKVWDEFCAAHEGQVILTAGMHDNLGGMLPAVRRHPFTRHWASKLADYEVTGVRELEGVLCKARADVLIDSSEPDCPIIDLKKVRSANPRTFGRSAHDLGYHIQAGFYCQVFQRTRFIDLTVESSPPYDVVPYEVPAADIAEGWSIARDLLRKWREAVATGVFPGRCPTAEPLMLERPAWAKEKPPLTMSGKAIA